jgi:hypothetical protein
MILMLLFPPFQFKGANGVVLNLGYGFLFEPPGYSGLSGTVNTGLLFAELLVSFLVGGMLTFALKDKKEDKTKV